MNGSHRPHPPQPHYRYRVVYCHGGVCGSVTVDTKAEARQEKAELERRYRNAVEVRIE